MSISAASWQLPKPVVVTKERDSVFPNPTWLKRSQVRRQTACQLLPLHARPGHTLRFKDEIHVVSALQKFPLLLLFSRSVVSNSAIPRTAALGFPVLQHLQELAQTHVC